MVVENLPQVVGEALKDSLSKFEIDNRIHQEEASTTRAEADKLKCDMLMQGLEFSRVENALNDELQSLRKDKAEMHQKLHAKLQDAVELESKLIPMRARIAELEEAQRTGEEVNRERNPYGASRSRSGQEIQRTERHYCRACPSARGEQWAQEKDRRA